jgi:hypothetical protein
MMVFGNRPIRVSDTTGWWKSRRMYFLIEFWQFLRVRKKYWLAPILIVMLMFGGLVVLTQGTAIAPFVYTIF